MTFERYVWTGTKRLRCGYTTGSCAALAAQAAARMLLTGALVERASITTPGGLPVDADVLDASFDAERAHAAVRKDAGDDVDATDGLLVCVDVSFSKGAGVRVEGGAGVGRVTKPGLDQPVGAAAINTVPRAMVTAAVEGELRAAGREAGLRVVVSVPEGEAVAARTFNPQLGIEGGVSILGTSGIVEPRSLAALRDSIALEIRQQAALGAKDLVIVPGNYGQDFARERLGLAGVPMVSCSNFIGEALDCAVREEFARVLVVGHAGKLAKVAGGVMDTHSRTADARCEILCAHAALAGADAACARAITGSATTDAAFDAIDGAGLLEPVAASLAAALQERLDRRTAGSCLAGAVMFSNKRGEVCRTDGARRILESWACQRAEDAAPEGRPHCEQGGERG